MFYFSVNQPKLVRSEESRVFAEKTETALESVALATKSKSAILVEANTNKVLFKKNETERLPIASMTKMMSLNLVFDAIKSGKIKADEKIIISENAASTEGSQAFLDANKAYLVEDLIKTVIIASANDSTVALSEAVCGSEIPPCRRCDLSGACGSAP